MSDDKKKETKGFLIQGPETKDGGNHTLRIDQKGIHVGVTHPADVQAPDDGQPRTLLQCERVSESVSRIVSETPSKGPSKVSTEAYRTGWENIFGSKQEVGQA